MGLPLIIIGLLMVITGGRGTYGQFGAQVASEFAGPWKQSFTAWLLAIGILGAIGYIQPLQKISRWLMALVIITIFLANKGFFAKFTQALNQGPTAPQPIAAGSSAVTSPGVTSTNPSGGGVINLGPLGTLNENPVVPGGFASGVTNFFGNVGTGIGNIFGAAPAQ